MAVNLVITMTNNNEQPTMNYSKQTQSNPILSAVASAKEDLFAFGGFKWLLFFEEVSQVGGVFLFMVLQA